LTEKQNSAFNLGASSGHYFYGVVMSIKKLAEYLGLSKSTVSRALNGYLDVNKDTREKVLKAAQELGYKANPTAKRLASGKSRTLGIILPSDSNMFVSPAFAKVLVSLSEFLAQQDYQLIVTTIFDWQDETQVYLDLITSGLVDGIFIARTRCNDPRLTLLEKHRFPYVCFGFEEGFSKESFIDVDNQQAFYQLTQRQISLGHTQIAFINASAELTLSQARKEGYLRAMKEAGLVIENDWILHAELKQENALLMTEQLMQSNNPPTSILCADDSMALGAIASCETLGYKPGINIAITGYGDYQHSRYVKPAITTINYDTSAVGKEMAKLMLNKLENTAFHIQNWHQTEMLVRQSDCHARVSQI